MDASRGGPSSQALPPASRSARRLPMIHFGIDAAIWALVIPVANAVRRDFDLGSMLVGSWAAAILLAVSVQALAGYLSGLYRRRWRYGSFDEVLAVTASTCITGGTLLMVAAIRGSGFVPVSVAFMSTVFVLTTAVALRSIWRLWRQAATRPLTAESIIVIGAGNGGYQIARHLLEDPKSTYLPVAFVDDDPLKSQFRLRGIKVEGRLSDLVTVARSLEVRTVLFAIPSAPTTLVREVKIRCDEAGLQLLILPVVAELFGVPLTSDIRPVSATDLLGRRQADVDTEAVASYITGKRVLVTGAGGSIGSELCRQLAKFAPAELMMLDRDESGLHGVQLSIEGRALLTSSDLILADLRDADRIDQIIAERRPDVIFHAAALKHLTLLEQNPTEAWKTNVVGTQNLLTAALRHGVQRVVNISTDKAADPICVLGYTKRITERLTAEAARQHLGDARYLSVRFGNVLGSRGSVLTTFEAQVTAGGPITLTHPEVTRFFMTITEAVRLSIYAGAIGADGQVLVLDMGAPVRIADVAERFAARVTPPLEIIHTGLRPGEKLHEVLFGAEESDQRPIHPLISHVDVAPLSFWQCEHTLSAATNQHPRQHNGTHPNSHSGQDPSVIAAVLADIAKLTSDEPVSAGIANAS